MAFCTPFKFQLKQLKLKRLVNQNNNPIFP